MLRARWPALVCLNPKPIPQTLDTSGERDTYEP